MAENYKITDFLRILLRLGISNQGPDAKQCVKKRIIKHRERVLVTIGGLTFVAWTVWTITYDKLTHAVMEAKREHFVSDTVKKVTEVIATVVFLTTTGTNTWAKDPTWNNTSNFVEGIGAAGSGSLHFTNGKNTLGGNGGGAGAYVKKNNVSLSGNPTYIIGAGASVINTDFASSTMVAAAGSNASASANGHGVGGTAASSTGDTKFSGGNGGDTPNTNLLAGSGGGGAAGKNGAGSAGASSVSSTAGGPGGNADNNTVNGGAAGSGINAGGFPGISGTEWDSTHGSGSGAGGSTGSAVGSDGAIYGGAGSGSGPNYAGATLGLGKQGLIVLTWTPAPKITHVYFMG